jgi:hypothetical protein
MDDPPSPKLITIMGSFGMRYAVDETGRGITLVAAFPGRPDLVELHSELLGWVDWYRETLKNPGFPWDAFRDRGLELARSLAEAISDTSIEVLYANPLEDPHRAGGEALVLKGPDPGALSATGFRPSGHLAGEEQRPQEEESQRLKGVFRVSKKHEQEK